MKKHELSMEDEFIRKLRAVLQENYQNELFGVKELSREIGISRSQLHRKIKKARGKSISQFIREFRLEKAKELLINDVATVSEISYRVGFNSPSYFIKSFRKYFGCSPGEAKNILDNEQDDLKNRTLENDLIKDYGFKKFRFRKSDSIYSRAILITGLIIVLIFLGLLFMNREKQAIDKSIAVLPFNNLSNDIENQHFVDGLVEDILSKLSSVEDFKVISRTSSDTYLKRGQKTVSQIAKELDVVYILEGSVQKQGNKYRISVQLIDAKNDSHIWSELYDRDINDIFQIQSEIALQITSELDAVLTSEESRRVGTSKTTNFNAFEYYNLGRFQWNKRTGEGYVKSIEYFESAIKEDSLYGLAYAGLSDTYMLMALQGWIDVQEGRNKAIKLAKRALELDPSLAEAHNVLASIYTYIDWNWDLAEEEYLKAIKLNPNYSTAYHYYSEHLSIIGRHEEARKMIDKAIELNPLSFVIRHVSTKLYIGRGEFQKAQKDNVLCDILQKNHPWTYRDRFLIYYYLGEHARAYEALKLFFEILEIETPLDLDTNYSENNMRDLLKFAIEKDVKGLNSARAYAILKEEDKVLEIIDQKIRTSELNPEVTFFYAFKFLHDNPRFRDLISKLNLPKSSPFYLNKETI